MSTPAARVGIAVAALAAVVALFFALAGSEDDAATARAVEPQAATGTQSVTRSASAAPQSASTRPQAAKPKPKPRVERIWVRSGKPAGGARRLEFKRGELVSFSVHSPVADEVHIHGFDITKPLPANRIVPFTFKADIEGVFEVELHEAGVKIAELRISP
jgi:hypothetical protein